MTIIDHGRISVMEAGEVLDALGFKYQQLLSKSEGTGDIYFHPSGVVVKLDPPPEGGCNAEWYADVYAYSPDVAAKVVADAIPGVWNSIAPDLGSPEMREQYGNSIPAADVVELCVDADRLHQFGFKDAYKASKLMLGKMDWDAFCKMVCAELPFKRYEL